MAHILVDTANTFFRARHVVRGDTSEKVGMAIHIMMNSIKKAWQDFNGKHVVFCLEGRSWRKDHYAPYKRNRKETIEAMSEKEKEENEVFWDELVKYYDEMMGLVELQGLHSAILAFVGLFSTVVLWKGDRELGIKLVGAWIGINTLGGAGLFWMMSRIGFIPDFANSSQDVEVIDLSFIENLTLVIGGGQIIICNGIFLAILALVSMKSKPEVVLRE